MSISGDVMKYLTGQPVERLHDRSAAIVAEALGRPDISNISKLMWSLEHTGRIALRRNGRNIVGVERIVRAESQQGRRGDSPRSRNGAAPSRGGVRLSNRLQVATPELDRYVRAKRRFEELAGSEQGEFIEVVFRDDAFAEEGLALRSHLGQLMEQYCGLSASLQAMQAEQRDRRAKVQHRVAKMVGDQRLEDLRG